MRGTRPDDPPSPSRSGIPAPWLIVVGASGRMGLEQLRRLLERMPARLGAAVLIVWHRPMDRPSILPHMLSRISALPVVTPMEGAPLRAGVCYVGPPDLHLTVGPGKVACFQPDHIQRNRTVDLLFNSAAEHGGSAVAGVVLAGALDDGALGLAAIRRAGGEALVIDSPWAVQGMPRAALAAVPQALTFSSVEDMADALARIVGLADESPAIRAR